MGDRAQNIARAVEGLHARGVRVTRQSSLYETEPTDVPVELKGQPWFLNGVIEAETDLQPEQLIRVLLEIERSLGRERRIPKGPRIIDLDILLFGSRVVHTPEVVIPHARMTERKFVLVPFAEIAAAATHPTLKKTIAEMLAVVADTSQVRKYASGD